jgi:hypothetical protein
MYCSIAALAAAKAIKVAQALLIEASGVLRCTLDLQVWVIEKNLRKRLHFSLQT